MEIVWHYAPWSYLSKIVGSGYLKASNVGADNELPMTWFSANQLWENTAAKVFMDSKGNVSRLTFSQQSDIFGCIRFGLSANDDRLLNWKDACAKAGTPRQTRRLMEKSGVKQGATSSHWYAIQGNVLLSDLSFQVWLNNSWYVSTEMKEMADVWEAHNA